MSAELDRFISACALLSEASAQAKEAAENAGVDPDDLDAALRELRRHIGLMLTAAGMVLDRIDEIGDDSPS